MAYVSTFEHDVFVSYAQVDDQSDDETGWVSTLVRKLKNRLAQLLGRRDSISVFIDHRLNRYADLTPQLEGKIRNSATMLAVLSPGYMASDWCQRELDAFISQARARGCRDVPIFVVERDRVPLEERPAALAEKLGYRFWIVDDGGVPQVLGVPRPMPDERAYYKSLDRLARELANQLKSGVESGLEVESEVTDNATVYVADVTDDLDCEWNDLKTALKQRALNVLPKVAYSRDPMKFCEAVSRDMQKADIFVQLLSPVVGRWLANTGHTTVSYQAARAKELNKPILRWRKPGLSYATIKETIDDVRHREILLSAQACELAEFVPEVLTHANKQKSPHASPLGPAGAFIFVDAYESDDPLAEELCDYLAERGYDVVKPIKGAKVDEFRRAFESYFLDCDAVIVVYGAAHGTWVQGQLITARKLTYKRDKPLFAMGLYEGPPPKPVKVKSLGLRLQNLQVIPCLDGLDPCKIRPFVDAIEQGMRAARDSNQRKGQLASEAFRAPSHAGA